MFQQKSKKYIVDYKCPKNDKKYQTRNKKEQNINLITLHSLLFKQIYSREELYERRKLKIARYNKKNKLLKRLHLDILEYLCNYLSNNDCKQFALTCSKIAYLFKKLYHERNLIQKRKPQKKNYGGFGQEDSLKCFCTSWHNVQYLEVELEKIITAINTRSYPFFVYTDLNLIHGRIRRSL